jgi:hypothetical protein
MVRLRKLSEIDLLPLRELADLENALNGLNKCYQLTEQDLEAGVMCRHCRFNPALEPVGAQADEQLDALDERIDALEAAWTRTLADNLRDPAARQNMELLRPAARKRLAEFLADPVLPERVERAFLQPIQEVLAGLVKVVARTDDLRAALLEGGTPATCEDLRKRFDGYLRTLTRGTPEDKVRVVLE